MAGRPQPITLGADKGYDAGEFVMELRDKAVTPHVAQNTSGRRSAIDGRTTRHPGYAISQRIRKRVEEVFGWAKTVAGLRKMRHRGLPKVDWQFTLAMAAYDLVGCPNCLPRLFHASAYLSYRVPLRRSRAIRIPQNSPATTTTIIAEPSAPLKFGIFQHPVSRMRRACSNFQ